jgi:hypothetical protein
MGAFFRVSEGGGYNLYGPTSRVVPGPEGPAHVPHVRWAAGEAACLRKWGLARHSTGGAIVERRLLNPNPHIPGGDSGG